MYPGERFNSISHLVGASLALAGGVVLVTFAAIGGDFKRVASYSVYGVTLFLLYLASTLYHSLRGRAKRVFQVLDHQAIYLLIAGTYTPFIVMALKGAQGWWMFGGDLGAGGVWHHLGRAAAPRGASGSRHHLFGNGLAVCVCPRPDRRCSTACRRWLVGRGWHLLYVRHRLLHS